MVLMHHRLLAIAAVCAIAAPVLAYDAAPARPIDLGGTWQLNKSRSDDAQQLLEERLEKERRLYERWRRARDEITRGTPQQGTEPLDAPPPPRRSQRPWQKLRDENFRKMLAISDTLTIRQDGAQMEIVSAVDARRVQAGLRSQVSMPQGELADSDVGWDGQWFVIERRVRGGPRVVEKYRILPKTGQLEYRMTWSGDTELSGIRINRIYDRSTAPLAAPDRGSGPVPY